MYSWHFYLQGSPISTTLRQTFTDNLLSTYEVMERSFMKNIYQLYKAIEFRTLWEGNPLTSFRRVASESAREIKTLVGVSELNKALAKVYRLKDKAVDCFSTHKFTLNLKKWSFDNGTNKVVSFRFKSCVPVCVTFTKRLFTWRKEDPRRRNNFWFPLHAEISAELVTKWRRRGRITVGL